MTWWEAIFLGTLQGITEFLPISSSGHLVLAQHFLGWNQEENASHIFFDGMLHWGTMLAVLLYYRQAIREQCTFSSACHRRPATIDMEQETKDEGQKTKDQRQFSGLAWLGFLMLLASLPAVVVTILLDKEITASFRDPQTVAGNLLILGVVLALTDHARPRKSAEVPIRWWQALLIGGGQALSAAFRGLSRSGMTISAALGAGVSRDWAVRFSFMLSVVASFGLGAKGIWDAVRDPTLHEWLTPHFLAMTALGTAASTVFGYASIGILIGVVRRARLWWFSIYLFFVGGCTLLNLTL